MSPDSQTFQQHSTPFFTWKLSDTKMKIKAIIIRLFKFGKILFQTITISKYYLYFSLIYDFKHNMKGVNKNTVYSELPNHMRSIELMIREAKSIRRILLKPFTTMWTEKNTPIKMRSSACCYRCQIDDFSPILKKSIPYCVSPVKMLGKSKIWRNINSKGDPTVV